MPAGAPPRLPRPRVPGANRVPLRHHDKIRHRHASSSHRGAQGTLRGAGIVLSIAGLQDAPRAFISLQLRDTCLTVRHVFALLKTNGMDYSKKMKSEIFT